MNSRMNWLIAGLLLHLYAEVAIWLPLVANRHLGLYPWAAAIVWCVSALWVLIALWKVFCHGREIETWLKHAHNRNDYLCDKMNSYRRRAEELEKEIVNLRHSFGIWTVNEMREHRQKVAEQQRAADRNNEQLWLTVLDGLHAEVVPAIPDKDYPHWVSEEEEYGEELV